MRKSKLTNFLTKEMLEYEYGRLGSMQKVADFLNISVDTVSKYMKLFNIAYAAHFRGIYSCNHDLFSQDTADGFYLAGFIAADGSLQKRKHSKILKLTLSNKDTAHLEKIKITLNSTHPIKEYIVKPSILVKSTNKCAEIQIASNKIFDDLARFNIVPNKTKTYTFPEWLIDHPLVSHYMRGYFDGDGCISHCGLGTGRTVIQKSFSIMGTYKFVETYNNILAKNCNLNTAKITAHYSIFNILYTGNNVINRIFNFLYKDAALYLDRKYQKFID